MSTSLLLVALLLAPLNDVITVRGRVVCTEPGHTGVGDAPSHQHDYVFETDGGKVLPLYRTMTSEALFVDARLHERHLEIDAGLRDDGSIDVFQIRSIIDGRLHDVHYWCDTCAIRANSPGPCWCCYQPFEFREPEIPQS